MSDIENSTIVNTQEVDADTRDTNSILRDIHTELVEMNGTLETNTNLIRDVAQVMGELVHMMSRR